MLPNLFYTPTRRDLLRLTGRDRASFLQGMVTNDVASLQPGGGCYAFMLDSTGHILADLRVLNVGESLLLDLEPGTAAFVAATLDKYLIMEKVRIADVTGDYVTLVVGGNDAPEAIRETFDGGEWNEGRHGAMALSAKMLDATARIDAIAAKWTAATVPTFSLYAQSTDPAQIEEILRDITDREFSEADLDALRIEAGIPRFGVDLDKSVLAPEARQDDRAVSRRKGCYIGQEIVARIDARGHTNRGLVGFFLDPATVEMPAHNAPVFAPDGKTVGRITSAAHSPTLGVPIALGFLRNEHAEPGTSLAIGEPGGTVAQVATLPLVSEATNAQ